MTGARRVTPTPVLEPPVDPGDPDDPTDPGAVPAGRDPGATSADPGPDEGPEGAADVGATPTESESTLVERCGWSLVWLSILIVGLNFWSSWADWPWAAVIAPLLVLAGILGSAAVWFVRAPGSRLMHGAGLVIALVSVAVPQGAAIHAREFYTTDSAAFDQVAGHALAHGIDPYSITMARAAGLLKYPWQFWTYTADGGHVTHVSYPAGSFLVEAAGMALGFRHAITDWVDLLAWLVTGVLLYALVPVALRWLSILVLLTSLFTVIYADGGTDALFLPFLVLAVWRWDRYGTGRGAGLARWIGPVALGMACAIKQTPWFCVPFLVAGVWLETRRRGADPWRRSGAYLGTVAAVFVAINLPFIVWQPDAWARGTLLPLTQPLVADGQGLVTLALHGLTGGVVLPLLTVAGVLAFAALGVAFVAWYPRMKRIWLFALPLVLFIPARSLSSYLVDCFPAALIAALTVAVPADARRPPPAVAGPRRRRWWAVAGTAVPAVAAAVVAVVAFSSAPLTLAVRGVHTSGNTLQLQRVTVTVHNRTDRPEHPHFLVSISGNHPAGFWTAVGGRPVVVAPGATLTVTLVPAHYIWSPQHGSYWLVEAYTDAPAALSTSPLQHWKLGVPES